MRTITNNYRDAHILNLGSGGQRGPYRQSGPYLVTQTGVAPTDALPKERMFVLRPDGRWVDFNAYACQGKPEAMDEIVFTTTGQIMETFGKLIGRPQVLDLPVDEAGLKAWLERQKGGNPLEAVHQWAKDYYERRQKKRRS
jgi:hypothetical protein